MPTEYQTAFVERIPRTPTAVSYRFQRPADFDFTAGQYMLVDLGSDLVHPLSLSSCPEETGFIEFTKRMTGSPFCQRLEALAKGEAIRVKGPAGKFCLDDAKETVVMIAGGIGITPLRSILAGLARRQQSPGRIILIYGNLNKEDIAFKDELENLPLAQYRLVHVLSDNTGMENAHQGFITAAILSKEVPENQAAAYMVSGPPVMVEAMKKALTGLAVAEDRISTDVFFGYD